MTRAIVAAVSIILVCLLQGVVYAQTPSPGIISHDASPPASSATSVPTPSPSPPKSRPSGKAFAGFLDKVNNLVNVASSLQGFCRDNKPLGANAGALVKAGSKPDDLTSKVQRLQSSAKPDGICDLCNGSGVNVCAFQDRVLAAAAIASDEASVAAVEQYLETKSSAVTEFDPNRPGAGDSSFGKLSNLLAQTQNTTKAAFGPDLTTFTTQAIVTAIEALAKLVIDRAKREAIGWLLKNVEDYLCNGDDTVHLELRTYWFPSLCQLAGDEPPDKYGAGAVLVQRLRAAIASDLRGWPGALVSIVAGALYESDTNPNGDMFAKPDDQITKVRQATINRITEIVAGGGAPTALAELSDDYDSINAQPAPVNNSGVYSERLQVLACALSIPSVAQQYDKPFADATLDGTDLGAAVLLTTFTSAPACWTIFGKGVDKTACEEFGGKTTDGGCDPSKGPVYAVHRSAKIEKLSTIVRLDASFRVPAQKVFAQWVATRAAYDAYVAAAGAASTALGKLTDVKPPTLPVPTDATAAQGLDQAAKSYMSTAAQTIQLTAERQVLSAGLVLARSAVQLVRVTGDAVLTGVSADNTPGLPNAVAAAAGGAAKLRPWQQEVREKLQRVDDALAAAQAIVSGDWATLANDGMRTLSTLLADSNPGSKSTHGVSSKVTKESAVLVALVSTNDPDQLAAALDEVAAPVGSWRAKQEPGAFTFSLTSHPGVQAIAAEWRWGTYGVFHESGQVYAQPPTLSLPIGFEFAWGHDCAFTPIGIYLPVIDPAAFLQYDVSNGGRLPGARLVTVVAPGAGLRWGISGTPFSVIAPMVVYRPGLRAWDSNIGGTGADALQVGVWASIDVTLFEFERKPEVSP